MSLMFYLKSDSKKDGYLGCHEKKKDYKFLVKKSDWQNVKALYSFDCS